MGQHITLEELSKASGLAMSTISEIERGIKNPTVTTLCMIAEALNCNPCDLFNYFSS